MRAYVEAQREYATKDRDGDEVLEYAQKFGSTPGKKDGLYWPPDLDGEISPLGPLVAQAQARGLQKKSQGRRRRAGAVPRLFLQNSHPPGQFRARGKYNYIINGNMIGGFALVAWPAEYGESGHHDVYRESARPGISKGPGTQDGQNRRGDEGIQPG